MKPRREPPTQLEYLQSVTELLLRDRDELSRKVPNFDKANQGKHDDTDERAREALRLDRLGYAPRQIAKAITPVDRRRGPYTEEWVRKLVKRGRRLEEDGTIV